MSSWRQSSASWLSKLRFRQIRPPARSLGGILVAALSLSCGCAMRPEVPPYDDREGLPGGGTTTDLAPFADLGRPVSNLPTAARSDFFAGRALAQQPWVKAPTITTARDGLGPLYNARACFDCHNKGGRGAIPEDPGTPLTSGFVRLSIPGRSERDGATPEPTYGLQLQTQSTSLRHQLRHRLVDVSAIGGGLAPEAQVFVDWKELPFVYDDGRQVTLRRPHVRVDELGYGPLHTDTQMSLRLAPPIFGAGLIELIEQRAIDALTDPNDDDGDGISGRSNRVWDYQREQTVPGRFGYKANRATLEVTVAGAFAGDIGISNPLFPEQPCTEVQRECLQQPHGSDGNGVEISARLLSLVVDFNRNLGVPKRRQPKAPDVLAGRRVFYELGCVGCHQPRFWTQASAEHPHLGNELIWPYSDFLLHDMGEGLADHRPDYEASGSEWRTTPLWGLGVSGEMSGTESYLHDGRARSIEEAILWHGGEADRTRKRFVERTQNERNQLITFLRSL